MCENSPPTPPPAPTPAPAPAPVPAGCAAHTVVAGDDCQRAAGALKTTVPFVTRWTGTAAVACTGQLQIGDALVGCPAPNYPPSAKCAWHVVAAGDSCGKVAEQAHVMVSGVTEGGLPCPMEVYLGDNLLICPTAPPPTPPPTPPTRRLSPR